MNGESESQLPGFERVLEACRGNKKGRVVQAEGTGWTKIHRCREEPLASLCDLPRPRALRLSAGVVHSRCEYLCSTWIAYGPGLGPGEAQALPYLA